MNKWIVGDERTDQIGSHLGFIILGLTQLGLYLVLFYQRYIEGLPTAYYNDVALILVLSLLGYWGARFFFGGMLPLPSFWQVLAIYLTLVAVISIPHTLVHGWPQSGEWLERLAPILGGPAVLIGGYLLLAYLGNKQIEKRMTQIEQ